MTENAAPLEMTEQDKLDLASINVDIEGEESGASELPHSLLDIWSQVLTNIDKAMGEHIDPAEASRVLRKWPILKMQEVGEYRNLFFYFLAELRAELEDLVAGHPKGLERTETDADDNGALYLALLLAWQLRAQGWSLAWNYADDNSHIQLAAIADAQDFVLGQQGLIAHLDQIGFDLTEADAETLHAELTAAAESYKEGK